jgi:hypothetical protein
VRSSSQNGKTARVGKDCKTSFSRNNAKFNFRTSQDQSKSRLQKEKSKDKMNAFKPKVSAFVFEKPLPKNVKFFNLSRNPCNESKQISNFNGSTNNISKSQLSFASSTPQDMVLNHKAISNQISTINNQLKRSIDLTLGMNNQNS